MARTVAHQAYRMRSLLCLMITLITASTTVIGADRTQEKVILNPNKVASSDIPQLQAQCLSSGDGYLRARLSGSIQAELDWRNKALSCAGSVRPDGGLRLRFSQLPKTTAHSLVLLFGINGIREGESLADRSDKVLAVNVTIMREGQGKFYSTQGDKCIVDRLRQSIVPGMPTKKHSYRIEARGFCNQPARELNGDGAVLITRFDFAGRVDLTPEDEVPTTTEVNP